MIMLGTRFADILNASNVKVHNAVMLGKYLHIDTNKEEEMKIRTALVKMGVKQIKTLTTAADGEHLDGSRHHRIVGIF